MNDTIAVSSPIAQQALGLSSGTIGTLTGFRAYAEIDAVQSQFVLFCAEHEGEFSTWAQAWNAFAPENGFTTSAD